MNVLLCGTGSRGDVQPLLALAVQLQSQGHRAGLCVTPDFREWIESFGINWFSIGPGIKPLVGESAVTLAKELSMEQARKLAADAVHFQFQAVTEAAVDCDLIIAGGTQFATSSVAEAMKIPYVFAAYCPATLPSQAHPPPQTGVRHYSQSLAESTNAELWDKNEQTWNELFGDALNKERVSVGLAAVQSVQRHIFSNSPWLAADPILAPAAEAANMHIVQTGAWLLPVSAPLPGYVEEFLATGAPPVYFGFGSMPAAEAASSSLIEAARSLGRRSILAEGWGNLHAIDADADCLSIGDIDHEMLLPRVAAVVHHGGAGTTTAAAKAGKSQVVIPHGCDQYYWAHRVQRLGIGVAGPARKDLSVASATAALRQCLKPEVTLRAVNLASRIEPHGAEIAVARLLERRNYMP